MKGHKPLSKGLWISGINPVREALSHEGPPILEMILSRHDQRVLDLIELANKRGIPVYSKSRDDLSGMVGHVHHQGIALRVEGFVYAPLETLLHRDESEREPLIVLDCVQDPQNLGALARSACFLGAKGLIIPKDRSAQITSTVMKISAGAMSYLAVAQVVNLTRAIEQLKEASIWVVGLDLQSERSLYETDLTVPLGLVVGNEQKGLRPLIRKHCDLLVHIPACGPLQSLNAAASAAVALAEVQRQRSGIGR
jgi:23S rRNA (guanosine2251-2'-O)-methyltransferase